MESHIATEEGMLSNLSSAERDQLRSLLQKVGRPGNRDG